MKIRWIPEFDYAGRKSYDSLKTRNDAQTKMRTDKKPTSLGAGAGSVFSLLPPENAPGNYVKVVQRVPVRIDFDRTSDGTADRKSGSDFNAEGLLKPGWSVEPEVRVR